MNNKKVTTWFCFAILMIDAMIFTVLGPLLSEISKTFNLSMTQAGFLFTVNFIGFSVFILFGGVAADYWGKKLILTLSLAASVVFLALFPLSPNFLVACIATFFIGGVSGILESIANALVADLNTEKTSYYVNLAQVFFGIGALVGPILIGIALSNGVAWKWVYFALTVIFLVLTIAFAMNKLPESSKSDEISIAFVKTLLTDKKFLLICLSMFLYTGAEVVAWGWMSTYTQNEFKFTPGKSSVAVGVFWAAITIGRLICTALSLRVSSRVLVIILAYFSVIVTIISGLIKSELQVWIMIFALGFVLSGQWSLIVAYGSENYKKSLGTIFAAFVGSGGVGMAVIPLVAGIIGENFGIRLSMMSTAIYFLIIALVFSGINKVKVKYARGIKVDL